MKNLTSNEIRSLWLKFFEERDHNVEESASLIPNNDKTLLWINAGVAPLKKYFDGSIIPKNPRIVNAQKCIRTNDIDNVGKTARHHTFFEMLGNFSIGNYFRDEIIPWALEILTSEDYFGFNKDKLYMTVYPTDKETYHAWINVGVEENHIIKSDYNFWEIGSGPCGPCTEIYYDRGIEYGDINTSVIENDIENDRFIEIWNIVFSQYNSKSGLKREDYPELPSKNIDTGMGLERMVCIIQDKETNFETDLFMPLLKQLELFTNIKYEGQMSFKVIVDHIRTVVFAISDGAVLSNEGRGYVLRRLLRRAIKHGKQLGINEPFLYKMVDTIISIMGSYYSHLEDNRDLIIKVVKIEENKFFETLVQGEKILDEIILDNKSKTITGEQAFTLYDTYGYPLELTEEIALNAGITVDKNGFKIEMEKQKERARSARKNIASMKSQNKEYLSFKEKDTFTGYTSLKEKTKVLKSFKDGVVLEKTPFYAESGGQVGDKGIISKGNTEYHVLDVQKLPNGQFMHFIENNDLHDNDIVTAEVDKTMRLLTTYNHSATHLLFAALREIVGKHVSQQGSQVTSENLRFDFNSYDNLSDETLLLIEKKVNEKIQENLKVDISEKTIEEAKSIGAVAEFGEKYGDKVRVINMGYTIDLCGGTHVNNTGAIKKFSIASIESKGSGIYRIVGHANEAIENIREQFTGFHKEMDKLTTKVNKILDEAKEKDIELSFSFDRNTKIIGSYQDVINKRIEFANLQGHVKELEKQYQKSLKEKVFDNINEYLKEAQGNKIIIKTIDIDKNSLKPLADRLLERLEKGFIFIANVSNNKVTFIAKSNINVHAGNIAKAAAVITGGNGGGRPDIAQAGGKDISKVDEALQKVKELVK